MLRCLIASESKMEELWGVLGSCSGEALFFSMGCFLTEEYPKASRGLRDIWRFEVEHGGPYWGFYGGILEKLSCTLRFG